MDQAEFLEIEKRYQHSLENVRTYDLYSMVNPLRPSDVGKLIARIKELQLESSGR